MKRTFGLFSCALLLLATGTPATLAQQTTKYPDITVSIPAAPFIFVAYGDVRFANPADTRHSNPEARQALVEKIAQEKPAFITIAGDLVLKGAHANDWAVLERETKPWQDIPVLPALGNHELRGSESAGLANYFQHFPQIGERRWYSAQAGNVMVFALDSNSDDGPGSRQRAWLAQGMDSLPAGTDWVLVTLHHQPYTKSTEHLLGGGHEARRREATLAEMLEERQKKLRARILVVSGHVHNYERYEHSGVVYIVSGGGGATPYMIRRGPDDFYQEPGPTYHYCRLEVDGGKMQFQMVKYQGLGKWAVKDSFDLTTK
jgi:hypothetical protein